MSAVLYNRMLDEVVGRIREIFIEAKQPKVVCERYIGRFTEDEVRSLANRCPRVLISLLGIDPTDFSDTHRLVFSAAVMTRSTSSNRTGEQALDLLNILIYGIAEMDAEWSENGAEDIQARSLYSGKLGETRTNLWAIGWKMNAKNMGINGAKLFTSMAPFETYEGTLMVGEMEEKHAGTV